MICPRYLSFKGIFIDGLILMLIIILIISFLQRQEPPQQFYSDITSVNEYYRLNVPKESQLTYSVVADTLKVGDVRPRLCSRQSYILKEKISIVTVFTDYEFLDIKNTLNTAIDGAIKKYLIQEIIMVDDGTTEKAIINEYNNFSRNFQIPIKIIVNEYKIGRAKSQIKAIIMAKYEILIFIDYSVICSPGWLEPLLDHVEKYPNSIAVPHYDTIRHSALLDYAPNQLNYIAHLDWKLQISMKIKKEMTNNKSPSFRGDLFVIRKSYLLSIGSIDDEFDIGGGELIELGLRTWLCGGSIKVLLCSRIAVVYFRNPIQINNDFNIRRLLALWFENYSDRITNLINISKTTNLTPDQILSIQRRKNEIMHKVKQCKNIEWFMKEVEETRLLLEKDVKQLGYLRIETGTCVRVANDQKLDIITCDYQSEDFLNTDFIFQLTKDNKIISGGKCLTAVDSAHVIAMECQRKNADLRQKWEMVNNTLINHWCNCCATHVTDPDQRIPNRQVLMVQNCDVSKENERFKKLYLELS